jgi:glycosyltransferase involved in cell wall biosynthesis
MRAGIDARSVYSGHGGIGTYAKELVWALARLDGDSEYFVLRTAHTDTEPLTNASNVTEIGCHAAMLDWRWEQLALPSLAEDLDLDVLHMTCFGAPLAKPCAVVSTVHDVVFRVRPDLVDPKLAASLDRAARQAARCADRVLTVSEFSARAIVEAYEVPAHRISVVYPGVGESFVPGNRGEAVARVRGRFGLEPGFVLYVGAIEPKKNIDGLLEAIAMLVRGDHPELTLALVGGRGGMDYDVGQAVLIRRLESSVRVLGYVAEQDLLALYRAAGVFVYPSRYEGFGLPPLEAMACGTPTVVANTTSLPEVVGEAGLLVDPEHPESIAEAVDRVLTSPELAAELRTQGLQRAAQFTWQQTAEQTLEVYRETAAKARIPCGC